MMKKIILSLIGIILLGGVVLIFKPRILNKIKFETKKILNPTAFIHTELESVGSIYGIDVSRHQGKINWTQVKSWKNNEISFVYIKATEGATYIDKTYQDNFSEAKSNRFLVGSYHYFRTTSSVEKQFNNFLTQVDKTQQDLIPLIDIEEMSQWKGEKFHKNLKEFLNLVEDHFGKKPMIYTVNSFYNKHLSGKYTQYHFLIGRYGQYSPNMRDNSNWTIWQFSESGKVSGIPKNVDIDIISKKYTLKDILLE